MKLEHCTLAFRDHIVFDDDTFAFADHRLNILVGDNGAGKTSLLNIWQAPRRTRQMYMLQVCPRRVRFLPDAASSLLGWYPC